MKIPSKKILFGSNPLTIEDVLSLSFQNSQAELSKQPEFLSKIAKSAKVLEDLWKNDQTIYGVTTGVGDSVTRPIPAHLIIEFPKQLSRFHGCGMGQNFDRPTIRSIIAVRLASLCRGVSGVRIEILDRLVQFLQHDILPRIPQEGSVGASGDLTPLSYIAANLLGEREANYQGQLQPITTILAHLNLKPLDLRPKEALAIMNGTSVMTAIACHAFVRAKQLCTLSSRITSLLSLALKGNKSHFDPFLFSHKPHPGQAKIAEWIARDINYNSSYIHPQNERLQDVYSIRCAPHIIGVLQDALTWSRQWIEIELNSANDNPLICTDNQSILHGGHFYGGHIAFVMDSLKTAIANIADLMDRQVALLVNEKSNQGLPSNLTGAIEERRPINHGFKALHIATSAWAAEALKLTIPASIFSRSTESHNQDKVSLGTIAARDCIRILELTEQVGIAALIISIQAFELRQELEDLDFNPKIKTFVQFIRKYSPKLIEDRPLESEIRHLISLHQTQKINYGHTNL